MENESKLTWKYCLPTAASYQHGFCFTKHILFPLCLYCSSEREESYLGGLYYSDDRCRVETRRIKLEKHKGDSVLFLGDLSLLRATSNIGMVYGQEGDSVIHLNDEGKILII